MPKTQITKQLDHATTILRDWHALGQQVRKQYASCRQVYGQNIAVKLAEKRNTSATDISDAKKFASRYTPAELNKLLSTCRRARFPLTKKHVSKLITITDNAERQTWQRQCIEERWTAKELGQRLNRKYGKRSGGGGKVRPPESLVQAQERMLGACQQLLRLMEAMKSADSEEVEGCGLKTLPESLRKQLTKTVAQVSKLAAECGADSA